MSFQNYDQFQGQPQGEQPNQTGSQPDLGQQMDASGNGFAQQGSAGGPPGSSGGDGQQGAGKTTLWSVHHAQHLCLVAPGTHWRSCGGMVFAQGHRR